MCSGCSTTHKCRAANHLRQTIQTGQYVKQLQTGGRRSSLARALVSPTARNASSRPETSVRVLLSPATARDRRAMPERISVCPAAGSLEDEVALFIWVIWRCSPAATTRFGYAPASAPGAYSTATIRSAASARSVCSRSKPSAARSSASVGRNYQARHGPSLEL
jgi:hypothetical protein